VSLIYTLSSHGEKRISRFYHAIPIISTMETPTTGQITIELNRDVFGYGINDEVMASLAPSGVVPGVYTQVEVNEKVLLLAG
jgi:hypothetical protein